MQFYNKMSRLQRPRNENCHAHYSLCARSMSTNSSMSQGKLTRGLCKCSPFIYRVCTCCMMQSCVPCMYINPLCSLLQSFLGYSGNDTFLGRIQLVCTCKYLWPHYQATLIFFDNIHRTLTWHNITWHIYIAQFYLTLSPQVSRNKLRMKSSSRLSSTLLWSAKVDNSRRDVQNFKP